MSAIGIATKVTSPTCATSADCEPRRCAGVTSLASAAAADMSTLSPKPTVAIAATAAACDSSSGSAPKALTTTAEPSSTVGLRPTVSASQPPAGPPTTPSTAIAAYSEPSSLGPAP